MDRDQARARSLMPDRASVRNDVSTTSSPDGWVSELRTCNSATEDTGDYRAQRVDAFRMTKAQRCCSREQHLTSCNYMWGTL